MFSIHGAFRMREREGVAVYSFEACHRSTICHMLRVAAQAQPSTGIEPTCLHVVSTQAWISTFGPQENFGAQLMLYSKQKFSEHVENYSRRLV